MLRVQRLRVLHEVAVHGSLAGAARALAFTPSAVSQQLTALEREAGVPLLERSRRGVRLTDAGRALVERTEVILGELARAEADLAAIGERRGGLLRVGGFPSAGLRLVPEAILEFAASHPGVELRLVELEPEESLPRLRLGELDLTLAFECDYVPLALDGGIEQETLFSEPMLVLDARGARTGTVDLRELESRTWIAPNPGSAIHEFTVRACQAAGFEPRITSVWNDFRVVHRLVAAGLGVAFVPRLAVSHEAEVVVRPVAGRPGRRILAAWRPGTARAPLVDALRTAFRAAARAGAGHPAG
jgi:DNA-binding transcriptional LysR family regulator